ncbi:uncharacterized protein [Aquarana catesbeiana]|uniref:uncharacterized protein n=1 Tax=Aquarana catesbeiana TaxID=8400 RepID=UPI003CCA1D57
MKCWSECINEGGGYVAGYYSLFLIIAAQESGVQSHTRQMDSEELFQCPYDKNHMIRSGRFQHHLVKCAENNKAVAKGLATCPFNARHRVPKKELALHMQTCENKCHLEPLPAFGEINYEADARPKDYVSAWQAPPCEENWEEESETKRSTFVLKEYGNYCPYSSETAFDNTASSATAKPSRGYTNSVNPTAKPSQRGDANFGNQGYRQGEKPTGRSSKGRYTKSGNLAAKPSQVGYTSLGTTAKPIQDGYTNRPSAKKPSQGGYASLGTTAKTTQEGYTSRSSAEKQSQGGYTSLGTTAKTTQEGYTSRSSAEKQSQGGYTSLGTTAKTTQEGYTNRPAAGKPSQGGGTNRGNPTVTKVNPWGTYQMASAAIEPEPVDSYENEWPRLENLNIKEQRQMK